MKKPTQLRIIFILNALMMVLPFIFYYVFTTQDITVGTLDPMWMVYTGIAYIASFSLLVRSILAKQFLFFRIIFGLNVLIAIPAGAYIGMLIAAISFALSFHAKVRAYFNQATNIKTA